MRQVCLFLQWVSNGKICLGYCRRGLCHKTKDPV